MTEPAPEAPAASGPDPVTPRWGLGDALLAFVAGIVGVLVVTAVYLAISGDSTQSGHETGYIAASLVGLWAGTFGVAWHASRRKGSGSLDADYGLRIEPRDVALGIAVGLACQFIVIPAVVSLFSLFDNAVNVDQQAKNVTGEADGLRLLALSPFLCLGAPFFEELYFRGLLQRSAVRRLGPVLGAALSAVAFGLVHTNPDVTGWSSIALITALAAFGAVLSWLAHRTGRLGPGLVAHATFNGVTLLALAVTN